MSTALVLEGGGMRGIFTAGVLDFFLDKNIAFDACIGVSAGASHACSYLSGQRGRAVSVSTDYLQDKRYCSLHSLINTGDIFGVDFIYHEIPERLKKIDAAHFAQNPCSFQTVVTNCLTGEAEYPYVRDIIRDVDKVRASASLPMVSRLVDIDGKPCLDGGIADPIPLKQAQKQGCEKIVLVLTRQRDYRKEPSRAIEIVCRKYRHYPLLVQALRYRHILYNQTLELIAAEEKRGRVFVIAPAAAPQVGRLEKDKEKLLAAAAQGYEAAAASYEGLCRYLGSAAH